jgi:hemoglobin/transferrin/lactoferrin receptor protein
MTNAMVLKDFQYLGMDSIYYQGVSSKVKAMQNVNKAFLKGTTVTLQIKLSDQLVVDNSLSITYGNYSDLENDTIIPLDHIPPIFGRTSVQYCYKKLNLEGYILYNGDKKLQDYSPSGEDNLQYATKEGMPSWLTINLLGNYKINKLFSVQAGVENILDKHYRTFASGISAPGRNFLVTVKLKLNGKD